MTVQAPEATRIDVAGVATALIDVPAADPAGGPPVLLLHGSGPGVTATANWRPVIPALSQDRRLLAPDQLGFGGTATVPQMREVIGLFAHDRRLITDELVELRYQASLDPLVSASWQAMFPEPRQRWVDDLALTGTELASITAPVLLVHGRDDKVVPWRVSSAQLIDLLPDARLHILSGCGHWTMIEKTAEFLAVVRPFLAP